MRGQTRPFRRQAAKCKFAPATAALAVLAGFLGSTSGLRCAETSGDMRTALRPGRSCMVRGSDLLVAALENEGVERIFGIPGEENLDVVESHPQIVDRARHHPARAGRGLHGGDLRQAHRQARRLHRNARAGRAEFHDRRGLRAARRNADDHDHRPEGHPVIARRRGSRSSTSSRR